MKCPKCQDSGIVIKHNERSIEILECDCIIPKINPHLLTNATEIVSRKAYNQGYTEGEKSMLKKCIEVVANMGNNDGGDYSTCARILHKLHELEALKKGTV